MLKRMTNALVAMGALALGGVASAANGVHYDYARVVEVEPLIKYVTVKTPVRECYEEEYPQASDPVDPGRGVKGPTIAGGIIGGLIGSQIGGGRGQDAAILAGTLIGSSVARNRALQKQRVRYAEESGPIKTCNISYEYHEEERIDGYRVRYEYAGEVYSTRMGYDPGNQIKVRVSVRPAE